jgi:hypothetical protein
MAITLHEVTTLQVLLMWSPIRMKHMTEQSYVLCFVVSQDVSLSTKQIMQQRRNKIISELFEHYEKINLPDPEVRMGNILLLLPDIEVSENDYQSHRIFSSLPFAEFVGAALCRLLCCESVQTLRHQRNVV